MVNDFDPDEDNITLSITPISLPFNGDVKLNPDGVMVYAPNNGFSGVDTFEYEICDDGVPFLCTTAIVTINVPLNVPQGFSPDGDGMNDQFIIEGIEDYPNNRVQIFNRWGNRVFDVQGYDNNAKAWTSESSVGVILGANRVPDGTYFYVIDLGDGSKPKSGFIIVNR